MNGQPRSTGGMGQDRFIVTLKRIIETVKCKIVGSTSGNIAEVNSSNQLLVAAAITSSALPTGAATAANQTTEIGHLATIAGDTTSLDGKVTACNTGAVTVAASALPTGAATETTLGTVAGDTTSIDGKITTCNTGAIAGSVTANAGTNLNTSALALETGGHLEEIADHVHSIDGKITTCNTGAIAGSVTANAGTNLNTSALALETGGNLATIAGDTTSIDGKITACNTGAVTVAASALPTGAATESTLNDVYSECSDINSKLVSGTDIGDVTINNGSGVAAVNIQDGGNSITVDGTVTATVDTSALATETTLALIKNTDGIKKITDALPAGTNLLGKVGIDQTTPGTTNNVYVTTVKPDGTNTAPSMDAAARRGYQQITDGTNSLTLLKNGDGSINTYGIPLMGYWQGGTNWRPMPTAFNSDTDANKGSRVFPVTHMYYDSVLATNHQLRPLDTTGHRGFVQQADQYGFTTDSTPNSELITTEKIRLVGTIFNGATLDSAFWTSAASTGTVTQASSELVLTSGTANGHYARAYSVRRANWVTGTSNKFRAQMRVGSSDDDVTVKFGVGWGATMPTITDGAYFKFVGSTISVNTMAATSETPVASGSFNGTYSAPTLTNNNTYEILYTLGKVYFLINNVIIHTATFSTTHWTSGTTNFHAFADVTNTGNSAAIAHTFRMINIARLGKMLTMPQYQHITGAATTVCKLGGGILHKIIVNQAGTLCTIYDQTSAAVPIMGILDTNKTTGTIGSVDYEVPFFNGLTIVTTGAGTDLTVVYE